MDNIVFPKGIGEITDEILQKYRSDLAEAATATENAVRQLRQQLTQMERNLVAINAQKALIDTFEKDLAAKVTEHATPTQPTGA
jgi:hypothetical protein